MRLIDADILLGYVNKYDTGAPIGKALRAMLEKSPTATIERDIPKAPTDQQLEEDGYGAWGSLYGHCPNCKGTVYDEQNYCEKCGQRLDWNGDPNGFNEETVQALKDTTERKNLSKVYETLDDMYAGMDIDCVPVIRCKVCMKKRLCSLYRETNQENGFCAWGAREE